MSKLVCKKIKRWLFNSTLCFQRLSAKYFQYFNINSVNGAEVFCVSTMKNNRWGLGKSLQQILYRVVVCLDFIKFIRVHLIHYRFERFIPLFSFSVNIIFPALMLN